MNGKINTPRTVCKAIVAVAIAAIAVAAIIGCSSLGGGSRRQSIATVIQTAYDLGGREMHLRRDAPAVKRSGWVSEANCEAAARPRAVRFPDEQRAEARSNGYSVLNSISNTLPSFNSSRPR